MWEYRAAAEESARAGADDLTAADLLTALLSVPYRMWDGEGRRIDLVYPADVAAHAGVSLDEWLISMEELAASGFMSWDEENRAHYLSVPTAGD